MASGGWIPRLYGKTRMIEPQSCAILRNRKSHLRARSKERNGRIGAYDRSHWMVISTKLSFPTLILYLFFTCTYTYTPVILVLVTFTHLYNCTIIQLYLNTYTNSYSRTYIHIFIHLSLLVLIPYTWSLLVIHFTDSSTDTLY